MYLNPNLKVVNTLLCCLTGIFLFGSCLSRTSNSPEPDFTQEIIAHRGASYLAPENTVASVKIGYELGADAVEIDIHLSNDKRIMVIHDGDTHRTAGGTNLIVKETHSYELRKLDVGVWKGSQFEGEKIPFLEDILALVPEDKKLFLDIKSSPEILPILKDGIEKFDIIDQLVIISFDKKVIQGSKLLMPTIPAYWLFNNFDNTPFNEAVQIAKENQFNGLGVQFNLVSSSLMQVMMEEELDVYAFTVNDPKIGKTVSELGIKGIITDRPGWLESNIKNPTK